MRTLLAILSLLLIGRPVCAQQYRFQEYRVAQGLPSDVIKQVTQDKLGFLWLATDDGLVRYDGQRFISYKQALSNQYAKGFLHTRDGRLLAFADLDIVEIINKVDTVIFKTVIKGSRSNSDSLVWYPKSLFEDQSGLIWIGEAQTVSSYDGKTLKRYDFGTKNRSNSFLRSFSFFEHNGELFCYSYQGNLFKFDTEIQKFSLQQSTFLGDINKVYYRNAELWLATSLGVYKADIENNGLKNATLVLAIDNASTIAFTESETMMIGSFSKPSMLLSSKDGTYTSRALNYNFHNVKDIYTNPAGDSWAATNKGLIYIRNNNFISPENAEENTFIESINQNKINKAIYFCTKNRIYKIDSGNLLLSEQIYENTQSYFQSLAFDSKGRMWMANMYGLTCFENGNIIKQWDFTEDGKFVHDVFVDAKNVVWASQAGNPYAISIDEQFQLHKTKIPLPNESNINLIREGQNGLYAASNGIQNYLFYKSHHSSDFKNISLPLGFNVKGDFNVYDIEPHDSVIWLATTEGLLKYNFKDVTRINLDDKLSNFSVKSVQVLDPKHLLFANSMGLFCYNTISGEYWLYDENAGLPSNTIAEDGIFIDQLHRTWVGTSNGLAFAGRSLISEQKTPKPICLEARVNGSKVRIQEIIPLPSGAFVNALFSSMSFPEKQVLIQWRWAKENRTNNWQNLESNTLTLPELPTGISAIQLRAKNAGMLWSDTETISFNTESSFWVKPWFILLVLMSIVFIAYISFIITKTIIGKRRRELEKLVNARTRELKRANEELIQRNNELDKFVYSASHDLSAPLKSLLGLIAVARLEKPNDVQNYYLNLMEVSIDKLEVFIKDVVNYSRNSRQEIKFQPIYFKELVDGVLENLNYLANYNLIHFELIDNTNQAMFTDAVRLKIILNNLLSNAIRFHHFTADRKLFIRITLIRVVQNYIITIEDNGKGIEKNALGKIFDMFYRANESATGSGLGLYILKETVTKLGGSVEVKSLLNEGSIFTITLPGNPNLLKEKI